LNYNADTTVTLTSPAINIIIKSGSVATTVEVGTSSMTVTMPAGGETFTVTSASRDLDVLSVSAGMTSSHSCSGGVMTRVIRAGTAAGSLTFSPTSAACSDASTASGGGGGGSGGSGGGGSATIPATPATPAVPGVTSATPATPAVPGAHSNGTLVLDGTTVYLIQNGKRVAFRDANEYKSHGFSFGQLVAANASDKFMAVASVQKALEGTLALDASDHRTVYMIGPNNTKRGFTSDAVFKQLGYNYKGLLTINLGDYATGAVISSATAAHPEGSLVLEGKTVWWIRNGQRSGFESEAVFKTYGFSFDRTVPANAADLVFPTSSNVKFRDGTLVKQGSAIYLISDGKKLVFNTMNALTGRGYKAANAITADVTNYTAGEALQ